MKVEDVATVAEETPAVARAAAQRGRILDAAEQRFIEDGFHGASMADIATTAGISAGLIYRYFDSKSAIVKAIIDRHLETDGCPATEQFQTQEDFCNSAVGVFERWRRRDDPKMNAALFLELTAECSRDPEIAKAVREKDHVIGAALAQCMRRIAAEQGHPLSAQAVKGRVVMLQCLVEGLASRALRDPSLRSSTFRPALEKIIAALMS